MTLKSVMLQLRIDQIEELDRIARRRHISRSELVRSSIDATLHPPSDASVAELYAAAYPDPVSGSDAWGDIDGWHRAAASKRSRASRDPW